MATRTQGVIKVIRWLDQEAVTIPAWRLTSSNRQLTAHVVDGSLVRFNDDQLIRVEPTSDRQGKRLVEEWVTRNDPKPGR